MKAKMPRMNYPKRLREYEKDKQRLLPQCQSSAEATDLLRELARKWRI